MTPPLGSTRAIVRDKGRRVEPDRNFPRSYGELVAAQQAKWNTRFPPVSPQRAFLNPPTNRRRVQGKWQRRCARRLDGRDFLLDIEHRYEETGLRWQRSSYLRVLSESGA